MLYTKYENGTDSSALIFDRLLNKEVIYLGIFLNALFAYV